MSDVDAVISLDDALDCYEMSKRIVSETPLYYYDREKNEFVKIKGVIKNSGVLFLNSYELCSALIDAYLSQPEMKEYQISFANELKTAKNKIVSFLWFLSILMDALAFKNMKFRKLPKN